MNYNATYYRSELTPHPVNTLELPMRLVSRFHSTGRKTNFYTYYNARMHKEGKGFLGFEKVIKKQISPYIYEEQYFSYEPNHFTMYVDTIISRLDQTNLHTTSLVNTFNNTMDANGDVTYFTHNVTQTKEDNHFEGRVITKDNIYDTYGNLTSSITDIDGIETHTTATSYGQYGSPIPSSPLSITNTISRSGSSSFTTEILCTYNNIGQLLTKTQFPNQLKQLTESFSYNALGNVETTTTTSPTILPRSSTVYYDGKGRHITTSINTLGQSSFSNYDLKWGKPSMTTSIGGQITTFQYDAFGRRIKTTYPQGYDVDEVYTWEGGNTVYAKEWIHPGKSNVKTYYDQLDREVQKDQVGYSQVNSITTSYDDRGNVSMITTPTGFTSSYIFDDYNRVLSVSNDYGTTSYTYAYQNGELTTTTTNAANQVSTTVTDASGKVIKSTDYGGTQEYNYHSNGGLSSVTNGGTILLSNTYDLYGRQTSATDINAGLIAYEYDVLGQLVKETSPLGQSTFLTYDVMGRIMTRTGPEGTTNYSYYPSGNGESTNQLFQIQSFGGDSETYTYDNYGRISLFKHQIDNQSFDFEYTYDVYNRLDIKTFPSGFKLKYGYNTNGYTQTIHNDDQSMLLYECMTKDELDQDTKFKVANSGNPTEITYQHSYITQIKNNSFAGTENTTWDYSSGNLSQRERVYPSKYEDFTYDNLNRLKTYKVNTEPELSITYANNGNILTKTDVGGNYFYDNAKIHAVNGIDVPDYNHISIYNQQVSYTPFQQPRQISQNDRKLDFYYNADYERIKSVFKDQNGNETKRYYLQDYEVVEQGGTTYHVHYISSGQHLTNIVVRDQNGDTQYSTLADFQGSIRAVHDWAVGGDSYDLSYDPWGRRRDPMLWNYTSIPTYPVWLNRGYTGHEHLDDFNIINMNGRLYDPMLARMLSPDNELQQPLNTQNYNRYSYVLNNPLRYTDPTGEEFSSVVAAAVGRIAIALTVNGVINTFKDDTFFKGWLAVSVAAALSASYGEAVFAGISPHLPSFDLNLGSGVNVSISPSLISGSQGFKVGASVNASYTGKRIGVGASFGGAYGISKITKRTGFTGLLAGNASFRIKGRSNISVSSSYYADGPKYSQRTATIGYSDSKFSIFYENDFHPFFTNTLRLSDAGDRYRTAAMRIEYGDYATGFNLFTGDPEQSGDREAKMINSHETYSSPTANEYRLGAAYIGYKHLHMGWNSESIRHIIQNRVAHDFLDNFLFGGNAKWFEQLHNKFPAKIYSGTFISKSYSLWE